MEETQELFSLSVDPETKYQLAEAARWARVLAICGTIFLLIFIAGVVIQLSVLTRYNSSFNNSDSLTILRTSVIVVYALILVISFFPLFYMFRFSGGIKNALRMNDQNSLNESLRYLKLYFRYLGVITIIGLAVFSLSFFIGIVGRAAF